MYVHKHASEHLYSAFQVCLHRAETWLSASACMKFRSIFSKGTSSKTSHKQHITNLLILKFILPIVVAEQKAQNIKFELTDQDTKLSTMHPTNNK